jgi:hypothetical protein
MIQTTLRKLKDQAKFKLSKRSKVIYTKQTKWRRSGGLMAYVFTSDSSGLTFKRVGSVKVWPVEFMVNKSTGSTVTRKQKK